MPQSISKIWTHLVFSTKNRFPFLSDQSIRADMQAYLATVLRSHDCKTIIVGGVEDHIHCLFALSKNHSIAEIVKEVKRTSSGWIKEISPRHSKFFWQHGYGAFSVSPPDLDKVRHYIEMQEEHHRRRTFQEEYRKFLDKYEIDYDERYIWD